MVAISRSATPSGEPAQVSPRQILILLLAMLGAMFDGFDGQIVGFVSPAIAQDWHLPKSEFGTIFAIGLTGLIVGSITIAPLADRLGRRPVAIVGATCVAMFTLLTAYVQTPLELIGARFATGVGLGTIMPILVTISQEAAPPRYKGLFVTLLVSAFPLGSFIGGVAVAWGLQHHSWRDIFIASGLIAAVFPLLFAAFLPRRDVPTVAADKPKAGRTTVASLFREGRGIGTGLLWLLFFASLLNTYMLGAWLPLLLGRNGFEMTDAVRAAAAFSLGGSIGGVVFGLLTSRFGGAILAVGYVAAAFALVMLGFTTSLTWVFVLTAVIGAAIAGGHVGNSVIAALMYPREMNATGVGWAQGVGRVGCVVGPALVGVAVGQEISNSLIFMASAAFAVFGALAAFGLAVRRVIDNRGSTTEGTADVRT